MTGPPSRSADDVSPSELNRVLEAIAAPTRRSILDLLRDGEHRSARHIAEQLDDISRSAVSRHLRVLRDVDLVHADRTSGAWRYGINVEPLECVYRDWLMGYVSSPIDPPDSSDPIGGTNGPHQPLLSDAPLESSDDTGDSDELSLTPLSLHERLSERFRQGVSVDRRRPPGLFENALLASTNGDSPQRRSGDRNSSLTFR